ncbi:MAG: ABC transporter ATP-binding protein [Gemmatimonadetes bacterium]|nr:ABC transporter ATP-binding protein [Gemmatimonadota bacterium]
MTAQLRLAPEVPATPGPTDRAIIETRRLTVAYGSKRALDTLDLTIPAGRIHAIVGANGAGKSTLFRVLLGFQAPSTGEAVILGRDSQRLDHQDRARIGYVNEEHSMPGWLRVEEVVAMQRRLYPQWQDARWRRIVGHFHVEMQQRVGQLSRGERAGVNLAMALAQSPELLILDEPTLGLDVVAKRAFLEAVLSSAGESGCTIIYCSHQMEEIERLADNLILLERGRLMHMSPPDTFCERVSLWVCDYGFAAPRAEDIPGVLQMQRIDGLVHFLVLDAADDLGELLRARGARRVTRGAVGLDRAVNAFLTRNHAAPQVESVP